MKNTEVLDFFDQNAHHVRIDLIYWIAGMFNNPELVDLFNDGIDSSDFGDIFKFGGYLEGEFTIDELQELLIANNQFGFVAKCLIPYHDNFTFKENGKVNSYAVHEGFTYVFYVYAETTDELLPLIEKKANEHYQRFIDKDKNKPIDEPLNF